jgi:cyclohexyl-isocyanide hydratase
MSSSISGDARDGVRPDRRAILHSLPFAAWLAATPVAWADSPEAPQQPDQHAQAIPNMMGAESIAMLIYPGFTALDLVGPHFFLSGLMGAKVQLVTNQPTLAPVVSDAGLAITPTVRIEEAYAAPDVLFIPGGFEGTLAAMRHKPTLDFVSGRSSGAKLVASVCTGSFILAAAGVLKGRRATSHWAARETLAAFDVTPVNERVVQDGKFLSGAGISAGLDAGLVMTEVLRGRPYAEAQMLQAEYAPVPPFSGGRPDNSRPEITSAMQSLLGGFNGRARAIAQAR